MACFWARIFSNGDFARLHGFIQKQRKLLCLRVLLEQYRGQHVPWLVLIQRSHRSPERSSKARSTHSSNDRQKAKTASLPYELHLILVRKMLSMVNICVRICVRDALNQLTLSLFCVLARRQWRHEGPGGPRAPARQRPPSDPGHPLPGDGGNGSAISHAGNRQHHSSRRFGKHGGILVLGIIFIGQ